MIKIQSKKLKKDKQRNKKLEKENYTVGQKGNH